MWFASLDSESSFALKLRPFNGRESWESMQGFNFVLKGLELHSAYHQYREIKCVRKGTGFKTGHTVLAEY